MNWGAWLQGLIAAVATALLAVVGVIVGLDSWPTGWQLFKVAIFPAIGGFLAYVKQSPPPIGIIRQSFWPRSFT